MRDGIRYALLVVGGLLGVLLVVSFTAWGLTTYGSVRHIVGDMAAQPDKAVSLQDQYEDMAIAFAGSSDSYTFHFNSAPVDVGRSQAEGLDRAAVIGMVLDAYTSDLYNGRLTNGGPGFAGIFFNATGNLIYFLTMLIIAVIFIAFVAGGILPFTDIPMPDRLKSAGKVIAVVCVLAFLLFAFIPGLIKSFAWGSIANADAARDILDILEPVLISSLLRNTLLMIIIGGILFGAGYYIEIQEGGQGRPQPARATNHQEIHVPRADNRKRRGL
jgi:hypothetical protein